MSAALRALSLLPDGISHPCLHLAQQGQLTEAEECITAHPVEVPETAGTAWRFTPATSSAPHGMSGWMSRGLAAARTWSFDTSDIGIGRDYSVFNPSLLLLGQNGHPATGTRKGTAQVFMRVSNMNFCLPNAHWREVLQRVQHVRSHVVVGTVHIPMQAEEERLQWQGTVQVHPSATLVLLRWGWAGLG